MLGLDGPKRELPEWVYGVVGLFNRCEQMKCLPESGGILDQNEKLMKFFDVIRTEFNRIQLEKLEREERLQKARSAIKNG